MDWKVAVNEFTNSGVIGEQNREEYKLPDESDDGEDNPNDQGKPDLLDTAQDEENITNPYLRIKFHFFLLTSFSHQGR